MDCIEITKSQSDTELTELLNAHVIGKKVTELEDVFCNDIYPVYFEDSTFAIHISIREVANLIPRVHRFVFHMKSEDNIVTEVINVTTGVLMP